MVYEGEIYKVNDEFEQAILELENVTIDKHICLSMLLHLLLQLSILRIISSTMKCCSNTQSIV